MPERRARLKEPKSLPLEIERKFLVTQTPPDIDSYPHTEIAQGYIEITPDTEKRIRRSGDTYYRTVKSGSGKTRTEEEREIKKDEFESLWPSTEGRRVEKTRYSISHGKATIELDVYKGTLSGLLTAEVEFKSEDASNAFEKPDWFGEDVTEDKRYKNQNLATHGIPNKE